MKIILSWLAPAMALSLPLGAFAQQTTAAPKGAPAAPLPYQSAFSDYKPWTDIKQGNWRELNDALAAPASGSRHGSGSRAAPSAQGQTPAHALPMPMPKGHQSHTMPGARP